MNVFEFQFEMCHSRRLLLGRFRGQPVLLVNTSSTSHRAPQLRKFQRIWADHREAGLLVIGIPCPDFTNSEPLTGCEPGAYYAAQFGVTFPVALPCRLSGRRMHPLFLALLEHHGPDVMPQEDFCKYLFGADGTLAASWDGRTEPDDPAMLQAVAGSIHGWIV